MNLSIATWRNSFPSAITIFILHFLGNSENPKKYILEAGTAARMNIFHFLLFDLCDRIFFYTLLWALRLCLNIRQRIFSNIAPSGVGQRHDASVSFLFIDHEGKNGKTTLEKNRNLHATGTLEPQRWSRASKFNLKWKVWTFFAFVFKFYRLWSHIYICIRDSMY